MKLTNSLYFYPEKGILDCNTYVVKGSPGIIIDPGSVQFLPVLIQEMRKDGIEPGDIDIITNTHLHGDHCWANEAFKEFSGAKITIHPAQEKADVVTVFIIIYQAMNFLHAVSRIISKEHTTGSISS